MLIKFNTAHTVVLPLCCCMQISAHLDQLWTASDAPCYHFPSHPNSKFLNTLCSKICFIYVVCYNTEIHRDRCNIFFYFTYGTNIVLLFYHLSVLHKSSIQFFFSDNMTSSLATTIYYISIQCWQLISCRADSTKSWSGLVFVTESDSTVPWLDRIASHRISIRLVSKRTIDRTGVHISFPAS